MRVSIRGYHALLAALLLAFCASPAFCRGRSLSQMQNMPAAGQFPLFGQPKLTAEQVRTRHAGRHSWVPKRHCSLFKMHACAALLTLDRVPGCRCACRLATTPWAASRQGGAAPPRPASSCCLTLPSHLLHITQASRLTGVWRMASSDEHFRLDGSLYDGVLLEALQAEGGAADLQDVASRSIDLSSSLVQYELIIPSVDARTGGPPGSACSPGRATAST